MDILIGWQPFECTFGGVTVTMDLHPLKRGPFLAIEPFLGDDNPRKKDESVEAYMARLKPEEKEKMHRDANDLQAAIAKIGPEYVRNLAGFTVNGKPPSFDDLAEEVLLQPIAVTIMTRLAVISMLPEQDAKNSEGPSGSTVSGASSEDVSPAGPHGAGSMSSPVATTGDPTAGRVHLVGDGSSRPGSGYAGNGPDLVA